MLFRSTPAKYNYLPFLELLCEKTPKVSKIIDETVLPTYCYARVYKNGDVLKKHTDRDACEISLTLQLDGDTEWSIYVKDSKGKEIEVNLKSGDALLYLGCDAPHWRNSFEGNFYSQVFLHYVRSRGKRSYAYFDKKDKDIFKNQSIMEEIAYKLTTQSKLEDFIQVFENVIPEELCDRIINEYSNDKSWEYSKVGKEIGRAHV